MTASHWTEERIAELRRHWEAGLSLSGIARTMGGLNRNQVVGKAHRLNLPKRPSPISSDWRRWYRDRQGVATPFRVTPIAPEEALGGNEISFVAVADASAPRRERRDAAGEMSNVLRKASALLARARPKPAVQAPPPAKAEVPVPARPAKERVAPPVSDASLESLFSGSYGHSVHFEGAALAVDRLRSSGCKWPIGDPRDGGFRFCPNASLPKGPYCQDHFKLAYNAAARSKPRAA